MSPSAWRAAISPTRRSSSARLPRGELCSDAQAPSRDPIGLVAKYRADASGPINSTVPTTRTCRSRMIDVRWEGEFGADRSLAIVNDALVGELECHPSIQVARGALEKDNGSHDVVVRHGRPVLHPPRGGRWAVMMPWEFTSMPRLWYEAFTFQADEIWVYSRSNQRAYVDAGVPAGKVHVVPLGVDDRYLAEDFGSFPLRTRKRFRFLFVGGTIARKGFDLLLEAYVRAFDARDDVTLVVKEFGAESYYAGQSAERQIRELQRDPAVPEIEYITDRLSVTQMRDLYRSVHCLVHPYRGEGFGLPIAEAMGSGLPVIIPSGGASADFCAPDRAVLLPARTRLVPWKFTGPVEPLSPPTWQEVSVNDLAGAMSGAVADPVSMLEMGMRGRAYVRDHLTWSHTARVVAARIHALASGGLPLARDPHAQSKIRTELASAALERGDTEEALVRLVQAAEIDRTTDAIFNVAAVALSVGDHRSAARLVDELEVRSGGTLDDEAAALRAVIEADAAEVAATGDTTSPVIGWKAAVYTASGYADESRNFLLGLLDSGGTPQIHLDPLDALAPVHTLDPTERATLDRLVTKRSTRLDIEYQHLTPDLMERPSAARSILRTMFETDGLPAQWARRCNLFDEVWVPSEFNRDTFARSGVLREKIRIVPGCFDLRKYDRDLLPRVTIPHARGFRFLSVFDFSPRKGWDLLLRAYADEFDPDEDVTLVMKVTGFMAGRRAPEEQVREFLASEGHTRLPHFVLIDDARPERELLGLYAACNAFVLPSRGEGWGRPYMEAMALGLPTIGTRWSANLEFMNDDNSFLVDIDGLEPCDLRWDNPLYQGQRWAAPNVRSLREQMRRVMDDRDAARVRGARARVDVARYDRVEIGRQIGRAFSTFRLPINDEIAA